MIFNEKKLNITQCIKEGRNLRQKNNIPIFELEASREKYHVLQTMEWVLAFPIKIIYCLEENKRFPLFFFTAIFDEKYGKD